MSEHSIITFHACSKPGAKYSSLEDEEVKSWPALCVRTATRWWWHQDVAAVDLQSVPKKMDGGGSLEGGHLQAGPAAQPLG